MQGFSTIKTLRLVFFGKIKREAYLWVAMEARILGKIMLGE
jgi:hypothetical protein